MIWRALSARAGSIHCFTLDAFAAPDGIPTPEHHPFRLNTPPARQAPSLPPVRYIDSARPPVCPDTSPRLPRPGRRLRTPSFLAIRPVMHMLRSSCSDLPPGRCASTRGIVLPGNSHDKPYKSGCHVRPSVALFAAVVEAGGFRVAAQKRGMSASSISDCVRRLESDLGVRLLNRTTRSVSPTEVGARLLERLRPALREIGAQGLCRFSERSGGAESTVALMRGTPATGTASRIRKLLQPRSPGHRATGSAFCGDQRLFRSNHSTRLGMPCSVLISAASMFNEAPTQRAN